MGKIVKVVREIDVTELGRKGGKATAANRTLKQRQAAARLAVRTRWDRYYEEHPDKLTARRQRENRKKKRGLKHEI